MENRFLFFAVGGSGDNPDIYEAVKSKEAEIIEEKKVEGEQIEDIVDEEQVKKEYLKISKKIDDSPIAEEYKKEIKDQLEEESDKWEKRVKRVDDLSVEAFSNLYNEILGELGGFCEQKEVKEVFEVADMFVKKKDKVQPIIKLEKYRRKSGYWKEINEKLETLGISESDIRKAQKVLGVKVDGKCGPKTINALSEFLDLDIDVKWSDKETKYEGEQESVEQKAVEEEAEKKGLDEVQIVAKNRAEAMVNEEELEAREEGPVVPKYFEYINDKLGLSREQLAFYFQAYMEVDESERIPVKEIKRSLDVVEDRYLKGVSGTLVKMERSGTGNDMEFKSLSEEIQLIEAIEPAQSQKALVEAFGKLINGQRENLISDEILNENIKRVDEALKSLEVELKKVQKQRADIEKKRQKQIEELGESVQENPDWYEVWKASGENVITQNIENLELYNNLIVQYDKQIVATNGNIEALSVFSFINQHQLLKNNGKDTTEILLLIDNTLGIKAPDFLQDEIEKAKDGVQDNPNASEVEKLFYEGEYEEALILLAEQNKERTKISGFAGGIGKHDIVTAYRKYKGSKESDEVAEKFEKDSFAAGKVKEGYVPVLVENRGEKHTRTAVFLVKESVDGSISYYWVHENGDLFGDPSGESGEISKNLASEHSFSTEEVEELENQDMEMKEMVMKIVSKSPSFKAVKEAGVEIQEKFAPLQVLFQKSLEGAKPENFVELMKEQARAIKGSTAISNLQNNIKQAQAELDALEEFVDVGIRDEFEQQIAELKKSLYEVASTVKGNKIDKFCDVIIDPEFEEDSFDRWLVRDGLPFLTAILVATAAIIITTTTFGVGGVAGLALVAAVGTGAGMVGYEIGTVGSHYLGKEIYGGEYSNKTLLGKYLTDEKVYNPETREYEDVTKEELIKVYGEQFVVSFVTTFALLGVGNLAGRFLSRFAAANASREGFKGIAARMLSRIPRFSPKQVNILEKKGFGAMMEKLGKEFLEETGEEAMETAAEKIHPALGFLVSLMNCTSASAMEYKMGKYDVVMEGSEKVGENGAKTFWSYDASKAEEFENNLRDSYVKEGYKVDKKDDGTIIVETSYVLKDGTEMSNEMVFKPETESLSMRKMFRENMVEGQSEIERLYGVKKVGDSDYEFDNANPEGYISLVKFLKRKGFVVVEQEGGDSFKAVKGDEEINFRKSEGAEIETESNKADEELKLDEEVDNKTKKELEKLINELPKKLKLKVIKFVESIYSGKVAEMPAKGWAKLMKEWESLQSELAKIGEAGIKLIDFFEKRVFKVIEKRTEIFGKIPDDVRSLLEKLRNKMGDKVDEIESWVKDLYGKGLSFKDGKWENFKDKWKNFKSTLVKWGQAGRDLIIKIESKIKSLGKQRIIDKKFRKQFSINDEIIVERSSGVKESGWRIFMEDGDGNIIVMKKDSNGSNWSKTITKEEILEWNPEGPYKKYKPQSKGPRSRAETINEEFWKKFKIGDEITVLRSNGQMDSGWRITQEYSDGRIRVDKEGVGYKELYKNDILRWNPAGPYVMNEAELAKEKNAEIVFNGWQLLGLKGEVFKDKVFDLQLSDINNLFDYASNPKWAKKLLAVGEKVYKDVLKYHYRELSGLFHPDKNPDHREKAEEMFKIIRESYTTLNNIAVNGGKEQVEREKQARAEAEVNKAEPEIKTPEGSKGLDVPKRNSEKLPFNEVPREVDVLAVGDLHGDYKAFENTLRDHGYIDSNENWIAGDRRVQFLGDIFDRGPDSMKILGKISEYKKQGARIDLLMGNHEQFVFESIFLKDRSGMLTWLKYGDNVQKRSILGEIVAGNLDYSFDKIRNLLGMLMYSGELTDPVDIRMAQEIVDGDMNTVRKWANGYSLDKYLEDNREILEVYKDSKLIEQVDDVLYMHAELSEQAVKLIDEYGIDGINKIWQDSINKAFEGDVANFKEVSDEFHVLLWSRAMSSGGVDRSYGYRAIDQVYMSGVLKEHGVNVVVHGHTPQGSGNIRARDMEGIHIYNIDIAMSEGMSGETPSSGGLKIGKDATIDIHDAQYERFKMAQ